MERSRAPLPALSGSFLAICEPYRSATAPSPDHRCVGVPLCWAGRNSVLNVVKVILDTIGQGTIMHVPMGPRETGAVVLGAPSTLIPLGGRWNGIERTMTYQQEQL